MRRLGNKLFGGLLLLAVVSIALAVGFWGAMTARAGSRNGSAGGCISYTTGRIPAGTSCMTMPWQLLETVAGASVAIKVPGTVCATGPSGGAIGPSAMVHLSASAVRIQAVERRPPNGGFQRNCGGGFGLLVRLGRGTIDGRRIEGESWPSPLHYGSLRNQVLGVPRLLGLEPAQAKRVLWLEGFHAHLAGHGRQVVSQVPGWYLVGGGSPKPDRRVTRLRVGSRVVFPTKPAVPNGAHTGTLVGAIGFDGGPPPAPGYPPRRPEPGIVVLFDTRGELLARFHVKAGHRFRLRLVPGRYLLIDDIQGLLPCEDTSAHVHVSQTVHVSIPVGCGIP